MLDLVLAILCSSSIALVFKRSETTGGNRYALTSTNYLAAALVSAGLMVIRGVPSFDGPPVPERLDEIGRALASGGRLSPGSSPLWAVLVGLGAGVVFFAAFVLYQIAVRDRGVALAGSFMKLGILLPASLALVVWRESPTVAQWIGTALAVLAIVLVHGRRTGGRVHPTLILLFLVGGLAEFGSSVFQRIGRPGDEDLFLLVTFGVALLLSLVALIAARRPVRWHDVRLGLAVGVPNLFSSWFLIRALGSIDAAVAFPLLGAGTVLVLTTAGAVWFREKFGRAEWAAVGITVIALVLANL